MLSNEALQAVLLQETQVQLWRTAVQTCRATLFAYTAEVVLGMQRICAAWQR